MAYVLAAKWVAKEGEEDNVLAALEQLAGPSRAEPGRLRGARGLRALPAVRRRGRDPATGEPRAHVLRNRRGLELPELVVGFERRYAAAQNAIAP